MAFGGIEGLASPPVNSPQLEHWFAQIAAEIEKAASGSGGVSDHGALTGLGDDDHPQYAEIAAAETISGTWTFNTQPSGIDHGALSGLGDDDHPQYAEIAASETITATWTIQNRTLWERSTGSNQNLQSRITGDSNVRWAVRADGTMLWGDGSSTDTNLYRDSANVLATDDDFHLKETHLRVIQGSGYGQVEATSWSRMTLLTQNLSYDGSGYPPDNMLYIDDTATSSQAGLMFMLQSNGNRFEWWFADAVDPGDAGAIAPTSIAARMIQSDGVFELLSDVNHLRIRNAGDAIITLDADTANSDEQANPWIQFYQDGQLVEGIIGFTGATDQDPTGATYTGMINNSMLINSGQALQLGSADTLRITIPTTMNGIEFGPAKDTNLYRDGANVLATDDEFRPLGDATEGSSAARPIIHHTSGTASSAGIQGALHTEDA